MGTHNQNGRGMNGGYDDHRPSWSRPQDHHDDDRFRAEGDDEWAQGQSGYAAGRHGGDRALMEQARGRNQMQRPGRFEEHDRGFGVDDRFSGGRGGEDHWTDRSERDYRADSRDSLAWRERTGFQGNFGGREPGDRGARSWNPQDNFRGNSGGMQPQRGPHRGKGPTSYTRSDERIRELICEALTDDEHIDASHIEVAVKGGEVTLTGTVEDRRAKRLAEDIADRCSGVKDIQNQLRVHGDTSRGQNGSVGKTDKNRA